MMPVIEMDDNHSQRRDRNAANGPSHHRCLHKRVEEDIVTEHMKEGEGGDTLEDEFSVGLVRQQEKGCIGDISEEEVGWRQKYSKDGQK
jgi:hypothetical protein